MTNSSLCQICPNCYYQGKHGVMIKIQVDSIYHKLKCLRCGLE